MRFILAFESDFFEHVNDIKEKETGSRSSFYALISSLLKIKIIRFTLFVIEHLIATLFWLPIPIYSSLLNKTINSARGLPSFYGMYFRSLYYRYRLKCLESNVLIDQNVTFSFPSAITLKKFCYIDKNVSIMSKSAIIGERVHIAPNVLIGGGGHFEAKDFSGIAPKAVIITASETLKNGSRASGPMVKVEEREFKRGKVTLEKDSFIGAGAIVLPNVIIGEGSIVGAGTTITKSSEPWSIVSSAKNSVLGYRERVKY